MARPPAAKKLKTKTARKASASKSDSAPVEEEPAASTSTQESEPARKPLSKDKDIGMRCIFAEPAELHLWDGETFIKQADVIARVAEKPTGGTFDYWLVASTDEEQVLAHKITSDMNSGWQSVYSPSHGTTSARLGRRTVGACGSRRRRRSRRSRKLLPARCGKV